MYHVAHILYFLVASVIIAHVHFQNTSASGERETKSPYAQTKEEEEACILLIFFDQPNLFKPRKQKFGNLREQGQTLERTKHQSKAFMDHSVKLRASNSG